MKACIALVPQEEGPIQRRTVTLDEMMRSVTDRIQCLAISASSPDSSMENWDRDFGSAGLSVSSLAAAEPRDQQIDKKTDSNA